MWRNVCITLGFKVKTYVNEVKINVLFVDASIWRNSVPTVSSLFKYYCRCMKSFGFLEMRSGAVIASNGLSEWKNRSDTKKTTCPLFFLLLPHLRDTIHVEHNTLVSLHFHSRFHHSKYPKGLRTRVSSHSVRGIKDNRLYEVWEDCS